MKAGELRHRITFQQPTEASDGMGAGGTITWTNFKTVWGAVWPLKSAEMLAQDKLEEETTHRIRVRHLSGLTAKFRIKFGTRFFNIRSIRNADERSIYMEILATEDV